MSNATKTEAQKEEALRSRKITYKGSKITLGKAADILDMKCMDIMQACYPKKGGGFREDDDILNICIANACRSVASEYANASVEDVAKDATAIALKAGYVLIDANFLAKLRKRVQSTKHWQSLEREGATNKGRKVFERVKRDLDAALTPILSRANFTKFAAFCAKWKIRCKISGTPVQEVDEASLYDAKTRLSRKRDKNKKYVSQKTWDKYINAAKKRWGALGALFFAVGRQYNPKLRRDAKKCPAPVSKNFPPKSYEHTKITATGSVSSGLCTITISVDSDVVNAMPRVKGGIERACVSASAYWAKQAEKRLIAKFSGIEI